MEKIKMIYIVRHGQTNYNVEGRYGGRIDNELNQKGIEQAYELHEKLKNIQFDKVFSSLYKELIKQLKLIVL